MNVIPAIDLLNSQCVRLTGGDFKQSKIYSADPVAQAQNFEAHGFTHLHLVDLDGAKAGSPQNLSILSAIRAKTKLQIDYSGGVRELKDIHSIFNAGAQQVMIGSIAVTNPEMFTESLKIFGGDKITLAADVKDGFVAISGWRAVSQYTVDDLLKKYLPLGLKNVMVTSVARDGMMLGPDLPLYQNLRNHYPQLNLIASGGVSKIQDLADLQSIGLASVVVGKAFYEGHISLAEAAKTYAS